MRNNPKYKPTTQEPVNSDILKLTTIDSIEMFKDAKHNKTRLTLVFTAENLPTIFDYYLN